MIIAQLHIHTYIYMYIQIDKHTHIHCFFGNTLPKADHIGLMLLAADKPRHWQSKAKRLCFIFLTQRMGHQSACTSKLLNFCYASKTNLRLSETGQAPQAWRAESHEMALRPLRKQLSETGLAVQLLQSVVGPCPSEPSQKSQLPACANNRRASHTAQHPSRSTPISSYI